MIYFEIEKMACAVLNLDYDSICDESREGEIENLLFEKFEVGFDQFGDIIKALLPFTPVVEAAFSGKKYHAFVDDKEDVMIVKQEVKEKGGEE